MKALTPLIAVCAILMACDAADPVRSSTTGTPPIPQTNVGTGGYVLTGIVRDQNGLPLPGARAENLGGANRALWGLSATTDERGIFSFKSVRGNLWVQVAKPGHHSSVASYDVDSDTQINVMLVSALLPSAPTSDTIQVGQTIRGITNQPPCDPTRWDARAPCRRFDFISPLPGHLEITIANVGLIMDATIVSGFGNTYLDTSEEAGLGEITLSIGVAAYTWYEVRVNSYYEPQEFNLRAEFHPSGP